jgi:hypothetical protein
MADPNTQVETTEFNLAEMSDDEVNNFDASQLEGSDGDPLVETKEVEVQSATETDAGDTTGEETDGAVLPDDPPVVDAGVADTTSTDVSADAGTDEQIPEPQPDAPAPNQKADPAEPDSGKPDSSTGDVDYKAEFTRVMAPFKAAKREIKLDNIEDARRLMQMGVDYSRKMEAMKPFQRVLSTLKKNDLLDIGRLNFLIDLDKKNPEAIRKFLKDSEIDPMDLQLGDDAVAYKPNDHMVGEQEVALDMVLDEIRETDTFERTAQVISKDWDTASRQVLFESPSIIRALNQNMQDGIFDQISAVVESERIHGRLLGLSDLEAYKTVGDAIQERDGFNQSSPGKETSLNGDTPQPSQDSGSESADIVADKLKNRRLAASSPRGTASAGKAKINLGQLSDAQIEKMDFNTL